MNHYDMRVLKILCHIIPSLGMLYVVMSNAETESDDMISFLKDTTFIFDKKITGSSFCLSKKSYIR